MRLTIDSRAMRVFLKPPRMWILESANTTRVREAFSMAYLVLPSLPAMRPMARAKWSPLRVLTSLISKAVCHGKSASLFHNQSPHQHGSLRRKTVLSMYKSSIRNKAIASSTSNPSAYARTKSAPF